MNSIKTIPKERWDAEYYYDSDPEAKNKTYNRAGAFIKDVAEFDPLFFNISPKEAELMDPQQRLFLEEAWKAIEDAGYTPHTISGMKCGVFVGASASDYADLLTAAGLQDSAYAFTGLSAAILPARISYFLNLKGPSLAIDTACSSSLVAVHEACESILSGESDIALAGGVALMLTPKMHIWTSKAGMLSQSEQCRVFDQLSDGIELGEGVGVIVLKRLSQAIQDHDFIYGVVKASGINQDGATSGITAPNPESQAALEMDVYERAKINPETITYVETHGTGTKLGDPIEISALTKAFRHFTDKKNYCAVGSVKANIGHTTMAAGIASVIKTLLALKHKQIAPHLNFTQLNEHIQLENSPFYITTELKDWNVDNIPRRAAVSSFGFSGTNAHLVIEEAPYQEIKDTQIKPYYLLTLSAKTEQSLHQRIDDLDVWLKNKNNNNSQIPLSAIAYTLNMGRSHFNYRISLVVDSIDTLKKQLEKIKIKQKSNCYFYGKVDKEIDDATIYQRILKQTLNELNIQLPEYKEKLLALANLYVKGYDFDWELLHQGESKQKISLPTYSFTKEKYWIPEGTFVEETTTIQSAVLHPLLDKNVSTLSAEIFTKVLTGNEFYLADHHVKGKAVLPGAAYIEMARAAGMLAMPDEHVVRLRNIIWERPIVMGTEPQTVTISLYPEENGVTFEVTTAVNENELQVHAQGKILTVAPLLNRKR